MATFNGVDVSRHNGNVNFSKIKAAGYTFAIIKAGGSDDGFYKDPKFETYYKDATAAGLHVGTYYYVGAACKSAAAGKADAKRFVELIKGKKFDFPVYLDYEEPNATNKAGNTAAAIAFCKEVESAGYYVGIYASDISGFKEKLNLSELGAFDKWVARYGSAPVYVKSYGIWQRSSTGRLEGAPDNYIDLDTAYKDYPAIIRGAGLNGYPKKQESPVPSVRVVDSCKGLTVVHDGSHWRTKDTKTGEFVSYTGIANNAAGWWYCYKGFVDFGKTGVEHNDNGWFYVKDGKVDFTFTGWANNAAGRWYCVNGKVDFDRTIAEAARLVWRGKFGDAPARKKKMLAAGFSEKQVKEIQAAVNKGVGI